MSWFHANLFKPSPVELASRPRDEFVTTCAKLYTRRMTETRGQPPIACKQAGPTTQHHLRKKEQATALLPDKSISIDGGNKL